MGAGWLVYGLVAGLLVAIACWAVEGLCRQHRLPTRWSWMAGLVTMVILSVRAVIGSAVAVASIDGVKVKIPLPTSALGSETSSGVVRMLWDLVNRSIALLGDAMVAVTRMLPLRFGDRAMTAWIVASIVALVAMMLVHLRIARVRREWPLAALHGHDVYIAPAVGPAVLGLVRPFIVVPRWLLARDADEQRLVLAHEEAHVAARDHLLLSGACIAAALVPWHPAVWLMLSRLRLAIELDCDARVLRQGVPARTYGTLLIDLAGQCSGFTVGATALADEGSHLERRLLAMKPLASRHARLRAGALAAIGALSILAACEAKMPTSADVATMDVASAEKHAAELHFTDMHGPNATYYVDGVKTDAEKAHSIATNRIGSVEVKKINGASEIRITTLTAPDPSGEPHRIRMTLRNGADSAAFRGEASTMMLRSHDGGLHLSDLHSDKAFTGVLLVDGVRVDAAKMNTLDPDSIVSVEVIKGPKALELSNDPAAVNGIIKVTTKAGAK